MINNYLLILTLFLGLSFFLYLLYNFVFRVILLNKYKNVIEIFEYFCKKTYTLIYQDQIVGYISNGFTNIPTDEYETIQRNFIKLVCNNMGKNNVKLCISFFGSNISFIANVVLYLKEQISNDSLLKIIDQEVSKQG